jgi:hypothetical protein
MFLTVRIDPRIACGLHKAAVFGTNSILLTVNYQRNAKPYERRRLIRCKLKRLT